MNRIILAVLMIVGSFSALHADMLVLDNFDAGSLKKNSSGENMGTWSSEAPETGKGLKLSSGPNRLKDIEGKSLRIQYNLEAVNREKAPIAGFFEHIKGGVKKYKYLTIHLRGDEEAGYPRNMIVELKDANYKSSQYKIEGITNNWKEFTLPLNIFSNQIENMSEVMELGLIFTDALTRDRGAIFIDDIVFSDTGKTGVTAKFESVFTEKKIALDGTGKSWDMKKLVPLEMDCLSNIEYGTRYKKNEFSARLYSCWDKDNFYVFTEVKDKEIVAITEIDQIQDSDGITLYFDVDNDGFVWGDADDIAVTVLPDGKSRIMTLNREPSQDEVRYGTKVRRGGYSEEIAVSWKFLKFIPGKGKKLAFTAAVQDLNLSGGTSKSRLNWAYVPKPGKVELGQLPLN
jgi:hypothetical protein